MFKEKRQDFFREIRNYDLEAGNPVIIVLFPFFVLIFLIIPFVIDLSIIAMIIKFGLKDFIENNSDFLSLSIFFIPNLLFLGLLDFYFKFITLYNNRDTILNLSMGGHREILLFLCPLSYAFWFIGLIILFIFIEIPFNFIRLLFNILKNILKNIIINKNREYGRRWVTKCLNSREKSVFGDTVQKEISFITDRLPLRINLKEVSNKDRKVLVDYLTSLGFVWSNNNHNNHNYYNSNYLYLLESSFSKSLFLCTKINVYIYNLYIIGYSEFINSIKKISDNSKFKKEESNLTKYRNLRKAIENINK
jgi:hypothetical protein